MIIEGVERCDLCGQVINERRVVLSMTMVRALWKVFLFAKKSGRHEFTRDEIDPFLNKGTEYATFGYWKWFGSGMVYTPTIDGKTGRGYWGFNIDRINEFFSDKYQVFGVVYAKGKGSEREYKTDQPIYLHEIPEVGEFMKDGEYVVMYGEAQIGMFS